MKKKIEIADLKQDVKKTEAADVKGGGEPQRGRATSRRQHSPITIKS